LWKDPDGTKHYRIHQEEYVEHVIQRYLEVRNEKIKEGKLDLKLYAEQDDKPGKKLQMSQEKNPVINQDLKKISTPLDAHEGPTPEDEPPGCMVDFAHEAVGSGLYFVRGSRPDCAHCYGKHGRRVTKWTRRQDRQLDRTMRYVNSTKKRSIIYRLNPRDREEMFADGYVDADHGGSDDTTKSTAGWNQFYRSRVLNSRNEPRSSALLDWTSKLEGVSDTSTPAVESVAAGMYLSKCGLPIWTLLEDIYDRCIWFRMSLDNHPAELACCNGFSKGLRHLRKAHRLSLGLVGDIFERPDTECTRVPTADNNSDIHTKALDAQSFEKHVRNMGMYDPEEVGRL
jgi:hypothetical protein